MLRPRTGRFAGRGLLAGAAMLVVAFVVAVSLDVGREDEDDREDPAATTVVASIADHTVTPDTASAGGAPSHTPFVAQVLEDGKISEEELRSSPLVADILMDAVVTEAEYERSVLAVFACAEDYGYTFSSPYWVEDLDGRDLKYEVTYPAGINPSVDGDLYDDCVMEFHAAVALAWGAQTAPTELEMEERRQDYLACMTDAGIDLRSWAEYLDRRPFTDAAEQLIDRDCKLRSFRGWAPPDS